VDKGSSDQLLWLQRQDLYSWLISHHASKLKCGWTLHQHILLMDTLAWAGMTSSKNRTSKHMELEHVYLFSLCDSFIEAFYFVVLCSYSFLWSNFSSKYVKDFLKNFWWSDKQSWSYSGVSNMVSYSMLCTLLAFHTVESLLGMVISLLFCIFFSCRMLYDFCVCVSLTLNLEYCRWITIIFCLGHW
jgi:hypothetical protein